jgi:hypothetical protein
LHVRDTTLSDYETKWFDKLGRMREHVFGGEIRRDVAQAADAIGETIFAPLCRL